MQIGKYDDFQVSEALYENEVELDVESDKRGLLLSNEAMSCLLGLDSRSLSIRYAYCYGLYKAGAFNVSPENSENVTESDIDKIRAEYERMMSGLDKTMDELFNS